MTDLSAWFFLVAGLVGGFLLSVGFWWYLNHRLVPNIAFSQEIAKRPSDLNGCGFMYRVKIKNVGRRRIIDLDIRARVAIYELGLKKLWNWYDIDITGHKVPMLATGKNRLVVLRPWETHVFGAGIFPKKVREKHKAGTVNLEDILELGTKAYVRIYVFGHDEFSGARKLYYSRQYRLGDIRNGIFRDITVVAPKKIINNEASEGDIDNDPISTPDERQIS